MSLLVHRLSEPWANLPRDQAHDLPGTFDEESLIHKFGKSNIVRATNTLPEIAVRADGRFQCIMLMNFYHQICVRTLIPKFTI